MSSRAVTRCAASCLGKGSLPRYCWISLTPSLSLPSSLLVLHSPCRCLRLHADRHTGGQTTGALSLSLSLSLTHTHRYWQASSLLLITVMLNIGEVPISSLTGFAANLSIACSLLWWQDLNDEMGTKVSSAARIFGLWRPLALSTALFSAGTHYIHIHTHVYSYIRPCSAQALTRNCLFQLLSFSSMHA